MTQLNESQMLGLVKASLDRAEEFWKNANIQNVMKMESVARVHSIIPGVPKINPDEFVQSNFIAVVADMRDSTSHIKQMLNGVHAIGLQRVFYEVSALAAALANTLEYPGFGGVTEFLGDGVLALYEVEGDLDEMRTKKLVKRIHSKCKESISAVAIINSELTGC